MAKFDPKKSYGEVFGIMEDDLDGAKYHQDGVFFDSQFNPINAPADEEEEVTSDILDADDADPADLIPEEDVTPVADDDADAIIKQENGGEEYNGSDLVEDLESLPWQEIKKRVQQKGGDWVNKIEGIDFLRGE